MALILALLAAFRATAATGAAGPAALLADGWRQYKDRFVTSEGRVVDNANGGISHSEGQGYAMLIAERLDDGRRSRRYGNGRGNFAPFAATIAAWLSVSTTFTDTNATDGDLLLAWALAEAGDRWHVSEYRKSARQIVEALAANVVISSRFGPILLPASTGFAAKDQPDAPVVNLSYWIFPAFKHLRAVSDAIDWDALTATGRLSRIIPLRPGGFKQLDFARSRATRACPFVPGRVRIRRRSNSALSPRESRPTAISSRSSCRLIYRSSI
jgi:endoglucanase